jgi:hypothetical protein
MIAGFRDEIRDFFKHLQRNTKTQIHLTESGKGRDQGVRASLPPACYQSKNLPFEALKNNAPTRTPWAKWRSAITLF